MDEDGFVARVMQKDSYLNHNFFEQGIRPNNISPQHFVSSINFFQCCCDFVIGTAARIRASGGICHRLKIEHVLASLR